MVLAETGYTDRVVSNCIDDDLGSNWYSFQDHFLSIDEPLSQGK
jgi:hypothetical protein